MAEQVKGYINNLIADATWDALKRILGGSLVLSLGTALWEKLRHGSLDWWAIGGMFVLTFIVIASIFRRKVPVASEPLDRQGKPAWQKLQWCNAERERLEGELRKCQEQDTSLRARTIATCDELMAFLKEYGPKPDAMQALGESEDEHVEKMTALFNWKAKMGADFRLRLSGPVNRIKDEIQVRCSMSERPLDKAIELSESQFCEPQFVEDIRKHLWKFAFTMTK